MRVFSNSASSLDGRLATVRHDHVAIGSDEDRRWMGVLRARADAVLVGGATWRNWSLPLVEETGQATDRRRPVVNAVLTRTGQGPRRGRFFDDPRTLPVLLGGPEADLDGFPDRVRVHRSPGPPTVTWALEVLAREHGVEDLLVEGGGDLIFQLLERDLLDEVYLTLCPVLIGGRGAPTMADGTGFDAQHLRRLDLLSLRQVESEVFLHYRVRR